MSFQWTTSICEAIGNRSPRLGVICCPPVKGLKYLEIFRSTVGCMQQLVAAAQALLRTVTGKGELSLKVKLFISPSSVTCGHKL